MARRVVDAQGKTAVMAHRVNTGIATAVRVPLVGEVPVRKAAERLGIGEAKRCQAGRHAETGAFGGLTLQLRVDAHEDVNGLALISR